MKRTVLLLSVCALWSTFSLAAPSGDVKGGLVVQVGCDDPAALVELLKNDSFIVQGLDTDPVKVAKAREYIHSKGLYGKVSAVQFDGKSLPYVDNLVNMVVVKDKESKLVAGEVERVLAPRGVAIDPSGNPSSKFIKPVPSDIDEWTHYLHNPDNNAVSTDERIHPPKYLQWVGSPRYSRHHDHMSVMSACVTAGGRIYHLMDESTRLSIYLKPTWKLVARDAFNGVILWKRDINTWYHHLQRLKSGPAYLPRKLVAIGGVLYAAPGLHSPAMAIDGATGKTVRTYVPEMETDEIIYSEGVLFLVGGVSEGDGKAKKATIDSRAIAGTASRRLVAVNADDGKILWSVDSKVLALTLTIDDKNVYYHDAESIVCLDRTTGKKKWASKPMEYLKSMFSEFAPTLVVYKDVLFFAGGVGYINHRSSRDTMYAISAKDGKTLWSGEHPPSGYKSPEDILVVDGLVWCAETTVTGQSGELIGRDPWTGEEKKRFPSNVKTYWFHHRCYRAKATENYFLMSRTGIEFVDHKKEDWIINHWVRGACLSGIMPANGFVYAPQHPCACYPEVKLNGFNSLSSHRKLPKNEPASRLVKGKAYNHQPSTINHGPSDWPTFRADAARSGSVDSEVPEALKQVWKIDLGGRVSQPVVADGMLLVAEVDAHTVHAFNENDGKKLWSFTAGARVDSAPTIYKGRAVFGSCDGWVYCLRADDGELAWKYQAAPRDAKHMVFEQIESVWPVHGNILIQNDVAYFACGRNIFLDGGIVVYRMNPLTGEVLSETPMTDVDPDGKPIQDYIKVLDMPPGQPDIMSSDGKYVYMRSQPFDLDAKRIRIDRVGIGTQRGEEAHLFCPTGFLDDSWWHRTYQVFGRSFAGGHSGYHAAGRNAPSGKLMVFDDKNLYAFARHPQYYRWTTTIEHHLYSVDKSWSKKPDAPAPPRKPAAKTSPSVDPMVKIPVSASMDPVGKFLAVEAWVKSDSGKGVVIARGGPANGYALILEKGNPKFVIRTDGDIHEAVAADVKVTKKWVHLAGVLGNKTLKIYVDGFLEGEAKIYGPISALPIQGTEIGADDAGSVGDYPTPFPFAGIIDEARIYHGELSSAEIKKHAKDVGDTSSEKAKLVMHISFDKGNAKDASGNGNNGALQGVKLVDGKSGKGVYFSGKVAQKPKGRRKTSRQPFVFTWNKDLPLFARAMVKVKDKVIVAGPKDIIDETKVKNLHDSPEMQIQMDKQSAMIEGKVGGVLWMVSDSDGSKLSELHLESPPLFDGMIAANGSLYISNMDGSVVCLRK
ncbi:MAG: PQQ-binding-like beta-propeller repeat protein [Kiritimatiellia bacterium]|jgi:outer membrane protein assembly factor BamB|nr:PQQ-binding-like beta-propeller repeat protein [Kiritimatiellia bacterium]MDP6848030.1 PQQ-binding-like beta-propeller repeat protein [Kiritimatiellia bacterium]